MHNQYLYKGEEGNFSVMQTDYTRSVNYISFLALQDIRMVEKECMLKREIHVHMHYITESISANKKEKNVKTLVSPK